MLLLRIRALVALAVLPLVWLAAPARGRSAAPEGSIFNPNFTYVNGKCGMTVEGPKGWHGAMQTALPDGSLMYPNFPNKARALYIKYVGAAEAAHPFNPMMVVRIYPVQKSGALAELGRYLSGVPAAELRAKPALRKFSGRDWATAEKLGKAEGGGKTVTLVQRFYAIDNGPGMLFLEASAAESEMAALSAELDAAVAAVKLATVAGPK